MKINIYLLIAIALIATGYGAGWHAKGVSVDAHSAIEAKQQLQDVTEGFQHLADKQVAHLADEQGKTLALNTQQDKVRVAGADIHLEIDHAVLLQPAPLGIAPGCPDPVGSAEFERLYGRAAQGADAPEAAASTGPG